MRNYGSHTWKVFVIAGAVIFTDMTGGELELYKAYMITIVNNDHNKLI